VSFWDSLVQRLQALGEGIVEWGILILVALLVLIVGRWLIGFVRNWIERLLSARPLDGLWQRSGVSRALEGTGQTPASITATVVYAYLMVALLLVVARILQLASIEALLERLLAWIPVLLLAVAVVIIAAAVGHWAANLVRPFADEQGLPWLSTVVHIAVVVFGVLFALELLQVEFAEEIVMILIAAVAIALAVAFGVGGIDTARKWWARYATPKDVGGPPPM
jgi:Conserved TM helix